MPEKRRVHPQVNFLLAVTVATWPFHPEMHLAFGETGPRMRSTSFHRIDIARIFEMVARQTEGRLYWVDYDFGLGRFLGLAAKPAV